MKNLFTIIFFLFTAVCFPQVTELEILPADKIYDQYYADALSHQFSLSKHLETVDWFGNIGNSFALFNFRFAGLYLQTSAAATAFSTIIKTPGHIQVYTIDYLVDFYADAPVTGNITLRFQMGHLSAHYADDGITELGLYPINYVRDYVAVHSLYKLNFINGRIYAGINYRFHNEPVDKQWVLQAGADAEKILSQVISLYAALDLKFKSEVNYGSTQSFQTGLKVKSSSSNINFRIAYTHRRGFEERGQLFDQKDIKNTIGFYFDF